jgi:hypothetical protein
MISKYIGITSATALLILSACSSSDSNTSSQAGDPLIIGDSESGVAADDATTDELRRSAARLASDSLGMNINEVLGIGLVGASDDNNGSTPMVGDEIEDADLYDDNVDALMRSSLALDGADATITREGNIITIDPDESAICDEQVRGGALLPEDLTQCTEVYQSLRVILDAQTDDTGVITYEFDGLAFLNIGYSPNGGSYEINLGGLKSLIGATGDVSQLPDTMTGAMRVVATLDDSTGVAQAGSVAMLVTEPISIVDAAENVNISLGNSELFSISSDGSGTTTIESSFGALSAALPFTADDDEFTGADDPVDNSASDIISFVMNGFTSQLDIDETNEEVRLSNTGSTLSVGINNGEAIRLSVSNYGMTLNSDSISISPGLTLGASLTGVLSQYVGESSLNSAQFNLSMPTGTVLVPDEGSGSTRINSGGLSYDIIANTTEGAVSSSFSASAGQCIDGSAGSSGTDPVIGVDMTTDNDDDQPLSIVDCGAP